MEMMTDAKERFEYYFGLFQEAQTPEERKKVIDEYTRVCFNEMELKLHGNAQVR